VASSGLKLRQTFVPPMISVERVDVLASDQHIDRGIPGFCIVPYGLRMV
jgi:hypothetical protein